MRRLYRALVPRPRVPTLGDRHAPGDAEEPGRRFAARLEAQLAPLEEVGEAFEDLAAAVRAVAAVGGPVGRRRAGLVLDREVELAAHAVEGDREAGAAARPAVADGVAQDLAQEE